MFRIIACLLLRHFSLFPIWTSRAGSRYLCEISLVAQLILYMLMRGRFPYKLVIEKCSLSHSIEDAFFVV